MPEPTTPGSSVTGEYVPGMNAIGGITLTAEGRDTIETNVIIDGWKKASVEIPNKGEDQQQYVLKTNVPLRGKPDQKVDFEENGNQSLVRYEEIKDQPTTRTGHDMFDALYAWTMDEARQNSVKITIEGTSIPVFYAGQNWEVWTRDTAYAVHLALAGFDPGQAKNSLLYRVSELKSGSECQILQDTGTGGSYPVSSDRVAWGIAAEELLKYLDDKERPAFLDNAYTVIKNTIEHDRKIIYCADCGLYMGETSFLDWAGRQTYPDRTYKDPLEVGTSKALSTNILHYRLLAITANLAEEKGLHAEKDKYRKWAEDLKQTINQKFYISNAGLYGAMIFGDRCPILMDYYDVLGEALAVKFDIADTAQAASIVSHYLHTSVGAPVVFPERKNHEPYHNRSIWPFAVAYWIEAAAKVKNAAVVDHGVGFLMKNGAFNLSNMEVCEALTGDNSQSPINSRRQLWSVAGYMAMVQKVVFGLDVSQDGIRFQPFITTNIRNMFSGDQIKLNNYPYKGTTVNVVIHLPVPDLTKNGFYNIGKIQLDGTEIGPKYVNRVDLTNGATFDIFLTDINENPGKMNLLSGDSDLYWAPDEPELSVSAVNGKLKLDYRTGGTGEDISYHIYRDGKLVVKNRKELDWIDPNSADYLDKTYFYAVQAVNKAGNVSFPSPTVHYENAANFKIEANEFINVVGGDPVYENGKIRYYRNWGAPEHAISTPEFKPSRTGIYQVSLIYGNGRSVDSGSSCGIKKVAIKEDCQTVTESILTMAQLGDWGVWEDSSHFHVKLDAAKSYQIKIFEDDDSINMSYFTRYYEDKPINYVNIAEVNLLFVNKA
ncbi:MAG TPA: amylo-alpha-1,6-glucosidase [Bacillota bacterium]|nr:amylo-alpha-1,6-glucosidase [Bacillota bacterium]